MFDLTSSKTFCGGLFKYNLINLIIINFVDTQVNNCTDCSLTSIIFLYIFVQKSIICQHRLVLKGSGFTLTSVVAKFIVWSSMIDLLHSIFDELTGSLLPCSVKVPGLSIKLIKIISCFTYRFPLTVSFICIHEKYGLGSYEKHYRKYPIPANFLILALRNTCCFIFNTIFVIVQATCTQNFKVLSLLVR